MTSTEKETVTNNTTLNVDTGGNNDNSDGLSPGEKWDTFKIAITAVLFVLGLMIVGGWIMYVMMGLAQ